MEWLMVHNKGKVTEAEYKEKHEEVLTDLYDKVKVITTHSRNVLTELKKKYPMVLVSNFYGNINEVLKEFQMDSLFQSVIESSVVGIRKPDHRIFTLGVKALGLKPEETVVVGDSFYKDIQPAISAGCHTIWFKGEGWTPKQYDETIPDKVIEKDDFSAEGLEL